MDRECQSRSKAACHMLHTATLERLHMAMSGATDMFAQSHGAKRFDYNMRGMIWRMHEVQGKKNCPALYVKRGLL